MTTKKRDSAVMDVLKRELGELSTRNFAHRFAASKDLLLRLDILRKLDKHRGCVNTISFNAAGDVLVSGSDDRRIILWDWETGRRKLSFHSGHQNNVFHAKFMPYTDDRCIVTCGADGQVRHAQILECGKVKTKLLAKHRGQVHKLAVEPGSSHIFYTCGADGAVQHIDLRTGTSTCLFTCKRVQNPSYMSSIGLNAIVIDSRNPNLFAIGGSDQFARLYDVRRCKWDGSSEFDCRVDLFCPPCLIDDEHAEITGLAFSDQSELLVSYSDEFIYLFTRDNGLGPDPTLTAQVFGGRDVGDMIPDGHSSSYLSKIDASIKDFPQAYGGHMNCETVKDVNFLGPRCEYVTSGSDCGRIFIWKKNGGELIRVIQADKQIVNCIESHPHTTALASSGIEHDIKIWIPKAIDRAVLPRMFQKYDYQDDIIDVDNNIEDDIILRHSDFDSYDSNTDNSGDYHDDEESNEEDGDNDDTDSDDDCDGDGVLNENEAEENSEEDDGVEFVFIGDSDDDSNDDTGSEDFYDSDDQNV